MARFYDMYIYPGLIRGHRPLQRTFAGMARSYACVDQDALQ